MMTPGQKRYWDKAQGRPEFRLMVDRLGLEVVETAEYKRNMAIEARVEGMIDQISMAPKEKRRVTRERKPWDEPDLSMYKDGSCPF